MVQMYNQSPDLLYISFSLTVCASKNVGDSRAGSNIPVSFAYQPDPTVC